MRDLCLAQPGLRVPSCDLPLDAVLFMFACLLVKFELPSPKSHILSVFLSVTTHLFVRLIDTLLFGLRW